MRGWLKWGTWILLGYAGLVGAVVLYGRVTAYLNGGLCPVPVQRPYVFTAIGAALLALGLSFFEDMTKGKGKENQKGADDAES